MSRLRRSCGAARTAWLALGALAAAAPVLRAQTADQAGVPVTVQVTASPARVTMSWPQDPTATSWLVRRRDAFSTNWTSGTLLPGNATGYVDNSVLLGVRYEYWIGRTGSPDGRQFVTCGIDAVAFEGRGKLVLLVDATQATALGARLDRLVQDLVGDGWQVLRHDVAPTASVTSVKALIIADSAASPGQIKSVFLLGRVPVPYSGLFAPDGHVPIHYGAWPADVYYGDLQGPWTDTTANDTSALRPENHNVPGDGKFDQWILPSDVEFAVGRVDFANMPSFGSETTLLQNYLDKDHDYRHRVFAVDQRAVIDDNFGWLGSEVFAASGWRNGWALVGPANTFAGDYFPTLNTTSGGGCAWSYGCGSGTYGGAAGVGTTADFVTSTNRNVFTMLFGSAFGDWDYPDCFLRAPLCTGWTLTSVWAGRPHWAFHPMAMGETIGACTRLTQNETYWGGNESREVHIALMGDPTLREHVATPATGVAVTDQWPQALITWQPSPDADGGYHVYRAASPLGPFTRLTLFPTANTSFVDQAALAGSATYMVRAWHRQVTPTGSYWNPSQGAFASTFLPQQPAANTTYGSGCYAPTPLQIAASPAPVSTATNGTTVGYTISNIPEYAPGSGARLGLTVFSFAGDLAGTSLAALGLPGCLLHVGGLDYTVGWVAGGAAQTTPLGIPPALPPGTTLYAIGIALVAPNTLNAFGAVTSNGVKSFVNAY